MTWHYIVVGVSVLLLTGLLWKEFRRSNRGRLIGRVLASTLAVIALACMVLPVSYSTNKPGKPGQDILLLTEGFLPDSLSAFQHLKRYTTDSTVIQNHDTTTIEFIPDLAYFVHTHPAIRQIHVLGYGLHPWELESLENYAVAFHPAPAPAGISFISWPQPIQSGDPLPVQGRYNNTSSQKVKLILNGLQTNLDSATLPANQESTFTLSTVPKHVGKAIYTLFAIAEKDTLATEKIPVFTQPQQKLKILLLTSAPDFENKFLKTWLYENQYALASRSTISKNKFSTEYLNMDPVPLARLTHDLLDSFDVLIADQTLLGTLRNSEVQALQTHIEQGLGLIIRASEPNATSPFDRNFSFIQQPVAQSQKSFNLRLLNNTEKAGPIAAVQALYLNQKPGDQPIVKDDQGRILASSQLAGAGKVLVTSLFNTYTLLLEGNTNDYAALWSMVISEAARKTYRQESWALQPAFPRVSQPVSVLLDTKAAQPTLYTPDGKVYLQQNYWLPFRWQGTFWSEKTGWQRMAQHQDRPFDFFVYHKNDWKGLDAYEKITATRQFARQTNTWKKEPVTEEKVSAQIPKLYFYLIFLVVTAFLWWESKLL